MALIGNTSVLFKTPVSFMSGASLSTNRANWNTPGLSRGIFYGEGQVVGVTEKSSVPQGYTPPYTWILAPKAGGLGAGFSILGTGTVSSGNLAGGKNGEVTMDGSGTISDANLGLILSAVATLSGIGGLSADVAGALQASATLAGQGDFTGSLGALAGAVATLSGSGDMTGSPSAIGSMSADIYVNQSTASVQEIVDAVWNALASQYNVTGTMGEATQAGGGGGGGATAAQIWSYASRTLTESAGLTTEEHDKLFSLENSTGGGGGFSSQAMQTSISNAKREILEKIEEIPQVSLEKVESQLEEIATTVNENQSQNDIAKTEIIDRIKEAEIDLRKDVNSTKRDLKEDNIKTRNLVRQKSEKVVKFAEKQLDRQEKIEQMIEDEAEEIEKVLEQNIEFEADDIENKINAQIDKEIEEIESNLPNNGNNNGTEG